MRKTRILCVLCILLLLIPFPVLAAESGKIELNKDPYQGTIENLDTLLKSAFDEYEQFGLSHDDFSDLTLGKQIPTYVVSNGRLSTTDSFLYPLFSGEKLIAFVTSFYANGILESMFSTDLSEIVNEHNVDGLNYAIAYDCDGVQLLTAEGYSTIANYPFDTSKDSISEISINLYEFFDQNQSLVNDNVSFRKAISFEQSQSARGTGNASTNVYRYYQGSYSICWAYVVASIGNSLSGEELYTGIEIAKALHGTTNWNQGASIADGVMVLGDLYSYTYEVEWTTLAETELYDNIVQGYPVYGRYLSSTNSDLHAVVIRAINTTTHYFSIMNPGTGAYHGYTNSSGTYTITYNSTTWNLEKWAHMA